LEDEINLAQYARTVLKHWKLLLGITLAAVIVAGVISFATPPIYEATVLLQPSYGEVNAQRMALLAKSRGMAQFVQKELADNTTPAGRNLGSTEGVFEVKTGDIKTGDIYISCTARHPDAQKAADLANTWGSAFIKYTTDIYIKSLLPPTELQGQIKASYNFYQEAQASYESFQRTSQASEISQQIADANLLYQALQLQESLKQGQGSAVPGDAANLAFLLLKLKAYGASVPDGTQFAPGSAAPVSQTDVDTLVQELENRSGIYGKTATQVLQEINTLTARLEQENQRSAELKGSRDTSWNAYLAALKTAESTGIERMAMLAPVRLVNEATAPQDPVPSKRLTNIGIALVVGLMLGVIAAFVAEYFEKKKMPPPAANGVIASKAKQSVDS